MSDARIAPLALDGWFVLHQLVRIPGGPGEADEDAYRDLERLLGEWEDLGDAGWSAVYRIVGGGTDYMFVHFRRTLEELGDVERTLARHPTAVDLVPTGDYLSVVELSMYALTDTLADQAVADGIEMGSDEWRALVERQLEEERGKAYVKARLFPRQPENMPYVCFYPMDKRRAYGQNWYTVPLGERAAMMRDHGGTGRRYAGRISQVISGSVGLDDWEWAVTLFGQRPNDFKDLITEMRYDEVSAVYAEFGSFWVGYRVPTDRIAGELGP